MRVVVSADATSLRATRARRRRAFRATDSIFFFFFFDNKQTRESLPESSRIVDERQHSVTREGDCA
jgi:hypothetical protein